MEETFFSTRIQQLHHTLFLTLRRIVAIKRRKEQLYILGKFFYLWFVWLFIVLTCSLFATLALHTRVLPEYRYRSNLLTGPNNSFPYLKKIMFVRTFIHSNNYTDCSTYISE